MSFFQPKESDMRTAADIVSTILLELKELTKPGVNLDMLDEFTARRIVELGATSYNKNYHPSWSATPFPATLCTSVDYEICHGIPAGRGLRAGSIVKYDLGIRYKSGCGDAALTVAIGEVDNRKERAMRYGLQALYEGIKAVKAGVPISEIGKAIERFCDTHGYQIIKEFSGHHIGHEMHEEPHIPHYYDQKFDDVLLQEGAVICIEPMITPGKGQVKIAPDGWTAYCPDGQPVVMFEHMILVGQGEPEILTKHISFTTEKCIDLTKDA